MIRNSKSYIQLHILLYILVLYMHALTASYWIPSCLCNKTGKEMKLYSEFHAKHVYNYQPNFIHSHKKWKDSLETRVVLKEISMLCWNLPSGLKQRGHLKKKTWLSLKGISCLQVLFMLIWMKQSLIWFNLQRDGTGNGLSNIKETFAECLQLQMLVLHQSMCIFNALVSHVHMIAG